MRLIIGLFCLVIGLFCLVIGLFCLIIEGLPEKSSRDAAFRVWGLGLGVWGLRFGV